MKLKQFPKPQQPSQNMGTGKHRWKILTYRSKTTTQPEPDPPTEFICPISRLLMADPVIVSSGQTFERACVMACKTLQFNPVLQNGSVPDLSVVISNMALKASILNWAQAHLVHPPKPIELFEAVKIVQGSDNTLTNFSIGSPNVKDFIDPEINKHVNDNVSRELIERVREGPILVGHAESELMRRRDRFNLGESASGSFSSSPLVLAIRPSCHSSCSSSESEFEALESCTCEDEGYVAKLRSSHVYEQEEGVVELRKITRSCEGSRLSLCTPRLLFALRSLITSKYTNIQVNSVAALVNLSLEKPNKVKIVRAGFVPPVIDVLKGGFHEAHQHACGALFSLALADENKTAIGVLGALQPLIHLMKQSESEGARHDAALALYHLSLVQSNRLKLVKLGSVQLFLGMVKTGQMPDRALLILCNLGACNEGRAAMLGAGAVDFFVDLLRKGEFDSESTRESCVAAIFALSHGGGLRFRGLAKAAGAVEVLQDVVEQTGRERARDKAKRILGMLKARDEEEEEDEDWEKVLESGFLSRIQTPHRGQPSRSSSEF